MKMIEREISPEDLLYRLAQRGYRRKKGLKGKRTPMTPVERAEARRRSRQKVAPKLKAERQRRIREGVCSTCGKNPASEGFKLCDRCRAKWQAYNAKSRNKAWVMETYGD